MASTQTVTVGCKLPHGLILQLRESSKTNEGVISNFIGEPVIVAGANSAAVIGGHGITPDVDKEFFDKWLDQNKAAPFVTKKLIFAHEKEGSVKAQATEQATNPTGFEGVDPSNPGAGLKPEAYEGMPKA